MGSAGPIKWLDLIIAALLIFAGSLIWGGADAVVSYLLEDKAPEKADFLAREPVRTREFALKRAQAELDSTRAKWVEQRLAGNQTVEILRARLDDLEQRSAAADAALAAARAAAGGKSPDATLRAREFAAKRLQAELDATRTKWVAQILAQNLSSAPPTEILEKQMDALERRAVNAEESAIDARRRAGKEYTAASFWFTTWKRLLVLVLALTGTVAAFAIVYAAGKVTARKIQVAPNWTTAMWIAACILAAVFGFQTAGPVAAVGAALAGLFLFLKP
jgi:hypothetical protein